jgi:hypothetical protein
VYMERVRSDSSAESAGPGGRKTVARILHEAFYCERRKHGIFGSILEVRTRMYFSTIRPQTSRINFALRARTFRTSTALATKFRAICGLIWSDRLSSPPISIHRLSLSKTKETELTDAAGRFDDESL